MGWSNWSGLEHATPSREVTPTSAEEVVAEVAAARAAGTTLKAAGTGHSFTAIASPGHGVHLLPGGLTGIVAVDREALTVTARAGMQLKALNAALEHLGLSLHNMGDIAEQTLAGAVSTGTHGTGGTYAGLAAQLAGFTLVTGTGEVLTCSATESADVFDLARIGLGAVGVLRIALIDVDQGGDVCHHAGRQPLRDDVPVPLHEHEGDHRLQDHHRQNDDQ